MAPKREPITQALLARAHSPDSAARLFNEKIQHRPIHLRPSSPPPSNARDARRKAQERKKRQQKSALKPKPLSASQRRRLGLYELPRAGQNYAVFVPLHELWVGYIREILGREIYTGGEGAASKLASADIHGAEVEVVRSSCVDRVGIRGIVIKDSKFALEVITRKNRVKLVPKEGTLFRVEVPAPTEPDKDEQGKSQDTKTGGAEDVPRLAFEIQGDQFMYRSADRASKKFKNHFFKKL